jgi:hypothetical protein
VHSELTAVTFHKRGELDLVTPPNCGDDRRVLSDLSRPVVSHRIHLLDGRDHGVTCCDDGPPDESSRSDDATTPAVGAVTVTDQKACVS